MKTTFRQICPMCEELVPGMEMLSHAKKVHLENFNLASLQVTCDVCDYKNAGSKIGHIVHHMYKSDHQVSVNWNTGQENGDERVKETLALILRMEVMKTKIKIKRKADAAQKAAKSFNQGPMNRCIRLASLPPVQRPQIARKVLSEIEQNSEGSLFAEQEGTGSSSSAAPNSAKRKANGGVEQLDGWKVEFREDVSKLVGKGAYSQVYKARWKPDDSLLAVKKLETKNLSKVALEVLHRVKSIEHKNLLRIFFIDCRDTHLFIVSQYCDFNLTTYIRDHKSGSLSTGDTVSLVDQVVNGYVELYKRDIIHRDLNTNKILVTLGDGHTPTYIVADFERGIFIDAKGPVRAEKCGTKEYMAPEVLLEGKYSHQADIWSLGIIFYEALVGRHPIENDRFKLILEIRKDLQNGTILLGSDRAKLFEIKYPDFIPTFMQNFLRGILISNAYMRYKAEDLYLEAEDLVNQYNASVGRESG